MSEWMPIETAPKGIEVLTYRGRGLWAVAIRYGSADWVVSDGCGITNVTHWMPLPPAPPEPEEERC